MDELQNARRDAEHDHVDTATIEPTIADTTYELFGGEVARRQVSANGSPLAYSIELPSVYDGVAIYVYEDGDIVNRFAGEGTAREEKVDEVVGNMRHYAAVRAAAEGKR